MNILVTSGTGTVGREVISRLEGKGHNVIAMTHSSSKNGVFADFSIPSSWTKILTNMDKVCLITPAMEDEGEKAAAFVRRAFEMGVGHIVFLGIHNVESAPHIPHFKAKIQITDELKKSGKPYTVIQANNFYQNDIYFLKALETSGNYLQPLGDIGLNRVDVRDISDAIVNALLAESDVHHFHSYPLVGPEPLNGKKTASIYCDCMKKEIQYPANSLDLWEDFMSPFIPAWLLSDWKMMYLHFLKDGLKASAQDLIKQQKILGKAPRKYEDYVCELLNRETL